MQLESLRLDLRERSPWEAMDLGLVLARRTMRPLAQAWLLGYGPVLIVCLTLLRNHPGWAQLLLWWMKPWYDRCFLAVLGPQVFGAPPGLQQQVAGVGSLLRSGLLSALTLYRLDPARSFNLPVWQLERLKGRERWRRATVLQRTSRGHAVALTLTGLHFELVLVGGLYGLIWLVWPSHLALDWDLLLAGETPLWAWAAFALALTVNSIIEPLYVSAGLTLYLNRRTELEGWDLELAFRRLARRLAPAATAALVLVACLMHVPARAEDSPADPQRAREVVEAVYQLPELGREETVTRWQFRDDEPDEPVETASWGNWLLDVGEALAGGFKVLAWVVVGLLALWLVWNRDRWARLLGRTGSSPRSARPATVAGLDVRRVSLPDDIAAAARAALQAGDPREALSLLYRGALARAIELGVKVRESDTEGDCLALVNRAAPPAMRSYFGDLTDAWIRLAYGHQAPDTDRARTLIDNYSPALEVRRGL